MAGDVIKKLAAELAGLAKELIDTLMDADKRLTLAARAGKWPLATNPPGTTPAVAETLA
jgi:hypothetical protein